MIATAPPTRVNPPPKAQLLSLPNLHLPQFSYKLHYLCLSLSFSKLPLVSLPLSSSKVSNLDLSMQLPKTNPTL